MTRTMSPATSNPGSRLDGMPDTKSLGDAGVFTEVSTPMPPGALVVA